MPTDALQVQIRGIFPMPEGCAVFLGDAKKVFLIHVDESNGQTISLSLTSFKKERPLTHDLIANINAGFGIRLERMVINDAIGGTFYARIILRMDNELGVKMVEVDARPSDAIVLALNARKPILVSAKLWEKLPDAMAEMQKLGRKKN
jgi:bifunctional DNase/RNase